MEEILSSIKRIIAEEGDGMPTRHRRPSRGVPIAPSPEIEQDEDEVLELSDPMPTIERQPRAPKPEPVASAVQPVTEPDRPAAPAPTASDSAAEPIVSRETAAATRAPLEALTRMMVKPEAGSDGTLEGLVREMLRPVLREWIDAHLPRMVEEMVAREIAKITGQP